MTHGRLLAVALVMTLALVGLAPHAVATEKDSEDESDAPSATACRQKFGHNACVALNYDDCTLFVRVTVGGCWL